MSDNPAVVAVVNGGDSKLQAVCTGSAKPRPSDGALSVTNTVNGDRQAEADPDSSLQFHRKRKRSIGHANGRLFGNAAITGTSSRSMAR